MLVAPALLACTQPAADVLLDRYRRAAVGSHQRPVGVITASYDSEGEGVRGTTVIHFDARSGRFSRQEQAGLSASAQGFDGSRAWLRDMSGFVKQQDGGDRRQLGINEAYRLANSWWRPHRGNAQVTSVGCGGVLIKPRGGKEFEAWFDAKTGLLKLIRETRSFGTLTDISYDDYVRRAGELVPSRIEIVTGANPQSLERLTLKTFNRGPSARAALDMPNGNPSDWSLPLYGRATVPFRLLNNHIIVDAMVDGRGPFPFLVDTGGHNILTPSTVAALGLSSEGSSPSSGAGEKTVSNGYAHVRTLGAGGAMVRNQTVLTLDFSPADVEGLTLGGMLGAEFLERFVVQIDYSARTITFIDPAKFGSAARARAGTPTPIRYYVHMPQVFGSIDGIPARLNLDTGARDEITLTSPFVTKNRLKDRYPGGVTVTTGWGVGGPSRGYTVRAGAISLGSVTVSRPVMGLSSAVRGSFSDAAYDGNVGSGLLKRFLTTFDYGGKKVYLAPLRSPDPDVGRFDRIGMWLNLEKDGLQVMDLAQGGPAAQAGLKVGDRVVAIGQVRFDERSLSDTRRALKLASEPLDIRFRRGAHECVVRVVPRDIISN